MDTGMKEWIERELAGWMQMEGERETDGVDGWIFGFVPEGDIIG